MKLKKEKKIIRKNSNKSKKNTENVRTIYTREEQEFFLSGQHATDTILERFADDQLAYFNSNPLVYHLEKYRIIRGVKRRTYYDWLDRNPYLKGMHAFCTEILALRRKEKISEHDPKFLAHTLHKYDMRHDSANKYKALLRSVEEESKTQPIKIIFEDYKVKKDD